MKKQYLITGGLIVLVVIVLAIFNTGKDGNLSGSQTSTEDVVSAGDPVDAVVTFYKSWLEAVTDNTASPFTSGLLEDPILNADTRAYIESAPTEGVDPVLCQSVTPSKIRAKSTFVLNDKAEVMVLGRGEGTKSSEQAAVRVKVVDGSWQITSIGCYAGESAPEREFSFEREGFLLKGVPPTLNADTWYLVFEENGEAGHTAPLFFDTESICIALDESEAVCDSSQLINPSKAFVQAQMTESGASVKRLQLVQ